MWRYFEGTLPLLKISTFNVFLVMGNISLGLIDMFPKLVSNDVSPSL